MADRTLRSAAVMAAGTVLSRLLGFVRLALIAAAIGTALRADIFNAANTIPNSLYILLAGGVFNTVLVPQLVRAIKNHDDGGQDFTNRILTFGFVDPGRGHDGLCAAGAGDRRTSTHRTSCRTRPGSRRRRTWFCSSSSACRRSSSTAPSCWSVRC